MAYLLDTNVISELRKIARSDPEVRTWYEGVPADELYLSVMTFGEIRRGIERIQGRDLRAVAALEDWLNDLVNQFSERILPITLSIADRWGRLSPRQPLTVADGLIAATAIEHKLTVVTRNTADFEHSGVNTLNPFTARPRKR